MTCAHCCFACGLRGHNMTRETFHKAIALAVEYSQHICLGGGEPTLHPLFKEFLQYAQWELTKVSQDNGSPAVGLVTNGTNTEIALKIAYLSKLGLIWSDLSTDQYHDSSMVDPKVCKAFEPELDLSGFHRENDHRNIRHNCYSVIATGRAKSWGNRQICCCDSLFITPLGNVFACGCKTKKLGNVNDSDLTLHYGDFQNLCPKYQKEEYVRRNELI